MARRKLGEAKIEIDALDEMLGGAAAIVFPTGSPTFGKSVSSIQAEPTIRFPALNRSEAAAVVEVWVCDATRLLTVDVDVQGNGFAGREQMVQGAMVRLRPVGLCTEDDVQWADDKARKLGALTVIRMPICDAGPITFEEPGDDDIPTLSDEEVTTSSMRDVLACHLTSAMEREGCSLQETAETISLAQHMLDNAGG